MRNRAGKIMEARSELIDLIQSKIYIVGKVSVCTKMGFSLTALNKHLQKDSAYNDNIEKLQEIAQCVADLIKEKENEAAAAVQKVAKLLA